MTDIVSRETRSRMMSGIRAKNTNPELLLRSALHKSGFRFRIHVSSLPGTPDIVLPKYLAVIIVNGCFWHGHDCSFFKVPKTNSDFWLKKIEGNRQRDHTNKALLEQLGWRSLTVWECATRKHDPELLTKNIANWLKSKQPSGNLGFDGNVIVPDRITAGVP